MPALNFPATPDIGDTYASGSGRQWRWDGTTWVIDSGATGTAATVDAKGDLLVGTADNTIARLPTFGTSGQHLVSNSFSTYGMSWITQDYVSKYTINAKGDLLVGTSDNNLSRLDVGANGYVLIADSAEATGVKWVQAWDGDQNILASQVFS